MEQKEEQRNAYYDSDLNIEAYNLSGIVQKFPNHFHEYYVIGFIEGGKRRLWCKNKEYDLKNGDLILFNPNDNHFCEPINGDSLDYRAVNINEDVMLKAVQDITGKEYIPYFTENVIYQSEITISLSNLYSLIVDNAPKLEKEEAFFFLLEQVLLEYSSPFEEVDGIKLSCKAKMICEYIDKNFEKNITLNDLTSISSLSKSYLLRSFTKQVGVTPYRYLQTVRIKNAKKLLRKGNGPMDVAYQIGFSDQSHFTNFFKEFIGLTPKQYQRIFHESNNDIRSL